MPLKLSNPYITNWKLICILGIYVIALGAGSLTGSDCLPLVLWPISVVGVSHLAQVLGLALAVGVGFVSPKGGAFGGVPVSSSRSSGQPVWWVPGP